MRAKDRPLENDFVTTEAFDEMLLAWFGNAARVLKPGGSFYIWGGYANLGNYPDPLKASGFYFSHRHRVRGDGARGTGAAPGTPARGQRAQLAVMVMRGGAKDAAWKSRPHAGARPRPRHRSSPRS